MMGHADIATTMIYTHSIPKVDAARQCSEQYSGSESWRGTGIIRRRFNLR